MFCGVRFHHAFKAALPRRNSVTAPLLAGSFVVYTVYMIASTTPSRIVTAACRQLHKKGAEAVTMRRVAAAVGVTPMAIYRHYPDRASLLNALADKGFQELAARL